MTLRAILRELPPELHLFLAHVFELQFDEEPDYRLLKGILKKQLRKHESVPSALAIESLKKSALSHD